MGSGLGLLRFPKARGVGRDGDGDGSVPDSRLRLLMLRPVSDGGKGRASLRPRRRPDDLCSLSDANGAGVEGVSCLIWWIDGFVPAPRSCRVSEVTEARDWDLLREASVEGRLLPARTPREDLQRAGREFPLGEVSLEVVLCLTPFVSSRTSSGDGARSLKGLTSRSRTGRSGLRPRIPPGVHGVDVPEDRTRGRSPKCLIEGVAEAGWPDHWN